MCRLLFLIFFYFYFGIFILVFFDDQRLLSALCSVLNLLLCVVDFDLSCVTCSRVI